MTNQPREQMLGRIRQALADVPFAETPEDVEVPRDYHRPTTASADNRTSPAVVDLFSHRVAEYRAQVTRCTKADAATVIKQHLTQHGIATLVIPRGFPADLLPTDGTIAPLHDDPPLSVGSLNAAHGAISACALAIAQTGTIVLDAGPGQGRRALTLLPEYHLCLVNADQIVASVPDAIARLDPTRALTMISGSSATSDIENSRVEGVHGPRTLHILVIDDSPETQGHRP